MGSQGRTELLWDGSQTLSALVLEMASFGHIASWLGGRRQAVALVLAGWIALVVMSAGSKAPEDQLFKLPDLRGVILGAALAVVLSGLIILPFLIRSQDGPVQRQPPKSSFALLIIILFIVFVVMVIDPDLSLGPPVEEQLSRSQPQTETVGSVEEQPAELGNLALLLIACAGTGALLLWSRYRLRDGADGLGPDDDGDMEPQLASAIADASAVLSSGKDPRSSVLEAYASLEMALTDQGRPRRHSETATEHLARVLEQFPGVAGPAVRLGQLYELARFSDHLITSDDQHEAANALQQSRSELLSEPSGTP